MRVDVAVSKIEFPEVLESHEYLIVKRVNLTLINLFARNKLMEIAVISGEDHMQLNDIFMFGVVVIDKSDDMWMFNVI